MVIIPTEKSFDWNHAPVALLAVVLTCVLVFFLYQSGDNAKFYHAIERYDHHNYFDLEWPHFERYLSSHGEFEQLDEYQSLYEEEYYFDIAISLLTDEAFYTFLKDSGDDFLSGQDLNNWLAYRADINNAVQSVSYIKYGLKPNQLTPLTLITHQFLHGGFMHLLGNMFFLVICGFAVEAAIGHLRFLLFYLLSGVAGGLLHSVVDLSSTMPLVGASGAISGVMAMYLAIFRLKQIEFFYWFFVFVGYFRAPALLILPFYIGKELFDFYTNVDSNVAFLAHAGGFIAGGALVAASLFVNPALLNEDYIEEDQSVDPFQEKLAGIYALIEKYRFRAALSALEALLQEYGSNFELERLRYNLSGISKPPGNNDAALSLLTMAPADARELSVLAAVWSDNPEQQERLEEEARLKLAMSFATPGHLNTAESIFLELRDSGCRHRLLGALARKLSVNFQKSNNLSKKREYEEFADSLLTEGLR